VRETAAPGAVLNLEKVFFDFDAYTHRNSPSRRCSRYCAENDVR
jgi:hypothetical protein